MKSLFMVLIISLMTSVSFANEDAIDFSKPPFWMPTYEELTHLKTEQIDFYVRGFEKIAQEIPALKGLKKTQILEATEWAEGWNGILVKFYRACQWEKHYAATCEKAADLRVDMLMLKGNDKLENRAAVEKATKKPASTDPAPITEKEMEDEE